MRSGRSFISVVLMAILTFPIGAEILAAQTETWRDWSRISVIPSGRRITVETRRPKEKLRGTFVSSDGAGITIRIRDGRSETISKERVRKVTTNRERLAYAPLIGAAAGFAVYAGIKPSHDVTGVGHVLFAGITAGIGALGGLGIWALGRTRLIYEAPKP